MISQQDGCIRTAINGDFLKHRSSNKHQRCLKHLSFHPPPVNRSVGCQEAMIANKYDELPAV